MFRTRNCYDIYNTSKHAENGQSGLTNISFVTACLFWIARLNKPSQNPSE